MQLVGCAIELIAEVGFGLASLSKIAERAGVAKSVVLYHFAGKEELLNTLVMETFLASVPYMVPPVRAEETARGKLAAYIRANGRFIDENRTAALAMYEMFIGYRSPEGKRLDQVMAESVAANPPQGELAELDPGAIFELGRRTGEFREFPVLAMVMALRQAIDGAVMFLVRDKEFDVIGYCEEVVTIFEKATKEGEP
ncbi:TetR/AcrR family transcriptional regulator [Kutzneria chonburiensis]|uniref:TetR/AcrR family transcriptional regulator n=1 Tax=Kutzneria chonburiensis TaxID=1483604 RepID=A0ABV6MUB1_9PSEU